MNNSIVLFLLLFSLGFYNVHAQSYRKDSLQFKIYTITTFKDSKVKDVVLDKVFCDYCSNSQLIALGQLGLKQSNKLIKKPKNRMVNGKNRLAIYLRISKKDFANIKQKDSVN